MKMFGFKTVLAAGAIALLGGQAGASTINCPEPSAGDTVVRYLSLSWEGDASLVTCLDHGTTYTGQIFTDNNVGYEFIVETENSNSIDLGGSLSGYLNAVNSSLFGGLSGQIEFKDPGTYDVYAILLKFGKNTDVSEGWFAFEVSLGGLSMLTIDWSLFFDDGIGVKTDQWQLSHTGLYGKDTTTIPLPAGGLLLLTALGGMALVRRRKMVAA